MDKSNLLQHLKLNPRFLDKEFWWDFHNGRNLFLGKYTQAELGKLNSSELDEIRKDHSDFKKKLSSLSKEDLEFLRQELWSCLLNDHIYFWHSGKMGRSGKRVQFVSDFAFKGEGEKTIIELGSGEGRHTVGYFMRNGLCDSQNYDATEIIPEWCQLLSVFGINTQITNLSIDNLYDVVKSQYDRIILTEVLEHLENMETAQRLLSSIIHSDHSILCEGGDLLIGYPNVVRDIVDFDLYPFGHHYQPDHIKINELLSESFEICDSLIHAGSRYHVCSGFKK
jgi:hypothetical protein